MKNEKEDIFDKIMHFRVFNVFEPFYKKYKEALLYLFFGGLTFVVSIATYAYFNVGVGLNELIANIISWIFAVTFAYITNRIWVFESEVHGIKSVLRQIVMFFAGRIVTLLVEEIILFIFISQLHFNSLLIKVIAQIVVIVLNYIISKLVVFRK